MALLNQNDFYYILSYNNSNPPTSPILKHNGWPATGVRNWEDKDYWYIEFVNGDAFRWFPLDTLIPSEILDKIKLGTVTLCISNAHEAYHYVIEDIYKDVIIKYSINPRHVLYLTNSIDIGQEIEIVSKKYNLEKLQSECILLFEYVANHEIKHRSTEYCTTFNLQKNYKKRYLTLNGLYRPHRSLLILLLKCYELLGQGYVSYNASGNVKPSPEDCYQYLKNKSKQHKEVLQLLEKNKSKLVLLDKMFIDTKQNQEWHAADYVSLNKKFYEDTYFSVVTETLCFPDYSQAGYTLGRAISEKTFKPILNKHPFLILGVSGVLNFLHELGYRTFDPVINEKYDTYSDPVERVYHLVLEIQRLVNLNQNELVNFYEFCKKTTDYNFTVLKYKNKFNYTIT